MRDWVLRCWDDIFGANHQAVLRLDEEALHRSGEVSRRCRGADELASLDEVTLAYGQRCVNWQIEFNLVLLAVGDFDNGARIATDHFDDAIDAADLGLTLRLAGLEELFNARQTGGDVETGDAAGVERSHGELCARLADRLRRHDADRLAHLNELARGKVASVAGLADASRGDAGEWRAYGNNLNRCGGGDAR